MQVTIAKNKRGNSTKKGSGILSILNWSADDVNSWGNSLLLGSLVVGVIATGVVIISGNIKEAQLKRDLAASDERTANAQKDAAEAKLALEKLLLPRTLSGDQQTKLSGKLKSFSGTTFSLASSQEKEPLDFVLQIEDVLIAAGWRNGRKTVGVVIEKGVSIQVDKSREGDLLPIAKALAEGLTEEGIEARAEFAWDMKGNPSNTIVISVGIKPQWYRMQRG